MCSSKAPCFLNPYLSQEGVVVSCLRPCQHEPQSLLLWNKVLSKQCVSFSLPVQSTIPQQSVMSVEMKRTSAGALGSLWSSPALFLQVSSISALLCFPGVVIHLAVCTQPCVRSLRKAFCVACVALAQPLCLTLPWRGMVRCKGV